MPYALVATQERLLAGLADGQLWESVDRGERWMRSELRGDALHRAARARGRAGLTARRECDSTAFVCGSIESTGRSARSTRSSSIRLRWCARHSAERSGAR